MLTAKSVKSRKVLCPTLPLFWTCFQKMRFFLSQWAYFLGAEDNVNFKKTYFLKRACVRMLKYPQIYYFTSVYFKVQHIYIVTQP